jgi:hypothetical protein
MHEKTKGYGVNVHEPKSQSIQENYKQTKNMSFSFINFFLDTILKKYKYPTASGCKYTKPKITTTKKQY